MNLMAIDTDPFASPANTASALGSGERCARIDENDTLDADEEDVDSLTVDITAAGVPSTNRMIGFSYTILYDEAQLSITSADHAFMLKRNPGSSVLDGSEPLPDGDANGRWSAAAADIGTNSAETGSGVLSRLTVDSDSGAVAGVYRLTLIDASHIDTTNTPRAVDATADGIVALNSVCPGEEVLADLSLSSVALNVPSSAIAGQPFTVTGGATAHNNGPSDPAVGDVTYSLNVPPGCTAVEPLSGTVQDVSFAVSASVAVPSGGWIWSITCNISGSHPFSLDAGAVVQGANVLDPDTTNNSGSSSGTVVLTAEADVKTPSVTIDIPPDTTVNTGLRIRATAALHNNGPFGPVTASVQFTLGLPSTCQPVAGFPLQRTASANLPVSTTVEVQSSVDGWVVKCSDPGPVTFTVDVSTSVDQAGVIDPSTGNNGSSSQANVQVLVPICGPDPAPAGDLIQNLSPQLIVLISQLSGGSEPAPGPGETTQLNCNYSITVSDGKGASIDDCEANPLVLKACTISIDSSIIHPGGVGDSEHSPALAPIAVAFLPPEFDLAGDTTVPNGAVSGSGSFRVRTDAGLSSFGITCEIDVNFPTTNAFEGGILPNVPDSNLNAALTNPSVWPNDLNAERIAVESALTVSPLPPPAPPDLQLWSRTIVPLALPGNAAQLPLSVLTWRIENPVLQEVTGARWVVVAFPGDALNPDPAGPSGGNPDFDEASAPTGACSPFTSHLDFYGSAGGVVARSCSQPGSHMAWALMDPDASTFSGDDGPRSDVSQCSIDADGDGLTANEETYYGSDPLNPDSDVDTVMDGVDNCPMVSNPGQADYDGDGQGDACDPDVDGDGAANGSDLCPGTGSAQPVDGNGCSSAQVDADADGVCDAGAPSAGPPPGCAGTDLCPLTAGGAGTDTAGCSQIQVDSDLDGICDPGAPSQGPAPGCSGADNCPQDGNAGQDDFDVDGRGDVCDDDDDEDGVNDADEAGCGGDALDAAKQPERRDLPGDEDGDGSTSDPLPPGAQAFDCDGDGYTGLAEQHVFGSLTADQDPCGADGWPSDFVGAESGPDTVNRISLVDLTSFLAPNRRLDSNPGDSAFDARWDLVPGGSMPSNISLNDLTALLASSSGYPPMLHGERAFGGPTCPWSP
jgi:hypothetical protein